FHGLRNEKTYFNPSGTRKIHQKPLRHLLRRKTIRQTRHRPKRPLRPNIRHRKSLERHKSRHYRRKFQLPAWQRERQKNSMVSPTAKNNNRRFFRRLIDRTIFLLENKKTLK